MGSRDPSIYLDRVNPVVRTRYVGNVSMSVCMYVCSSVLACLVEAGTLVWLFRLAREGGKGTGGAWPLPALERFAR